MALPLKLYASGNRAPCLGGVENDPDSITPSISTLPSDEFWTAFDRRYGVNPALQSEELKRYVEPSLRRDFALVEKYRGVLANDNNARYEGVKPRKLPRGVPLVAIGANGDERYAREQVAAWCMHVDGGCGGSVFDERWFDGAAPETPSGPGSAGLGPSASRGGARWATPHRIVIEYPDELLAYLGEDVNALVAAMGEAPVAAAAAA